MPKVPKYPVLCPGNPFIPCYNKDKECIKSKVQWYLENCEAYVQFDKEKKASYTKRRCAKDPVECARRQKTNLARKFSIDTDEYLELTSKPCEICNTTSNLVVDHNHKTKKVRGTLCKNCNSAIGLLKDSPERLRSAIKYLESKGCYGHDC